MSFAFCIGCHRCGVRLSVLWANVKAGITPAVFKFYNRMEAFDVPKDASTYNAMIWASEMEGEEGAVETLKYH